MLPIIISGSLTAGARKYSKPPTLLPDGMVTSTANYNLKELMSGSYDTPIALERNRINRGVWC